MDFYTVQYLLNERKTVADIIKGIESATLEDTSITAERMKPDTVYEMK